MRTIEALQEGIDARALLHAQVSGTREMDPGMRQIMHRFPQAPRIILWRTHLWPVATAGHEAFRGMILDPNLVPPGAAIWVFDQSPELTEDLQQDLDIQDVNPALYALATIPIESRQTPNGAGGIVWVLMMVARDRRAGDPTERAQLLYGWAEYGQTCPPGYEVFAASTAFLAQPFIEVAPAGSSRAERRQADRMKQDIEQVHTVTLRRREQTHKLQDRSTQEPREVEWSCQWLVRSHWRKPSPLMKEPRPVYVRPYWKGPEDKPLRSPDSLVYVAAR